MEHPAAVAVKLEEAEDDEVVVVLDADGDAGGRAAAAPAPEPWRTPAASQQVSPFLAKTFELVEDPATDGVVALLQARQLLHLPPAAQHLRQQLITFPIRNY